MTSTDTTTEHAAGSETDGDDLAALLNSVIEQSIPAMHGLGIRAVQLEPGHVIGSAPLEGNVNHLGTMYAGTLFGLAEMLGGAMFGASFDIARFHPTVKDLQIRFRRPATSDVRAEARLDGATLERLRAEAEERGKVEFVLEARLTDAAGEVVATTVGTYQVRANRPLRPSEAAAPGHQPMPADTTDRQSQ
jgi:thioesterase domain-containing protein